jgi:hypothetical protein
MGVQPGQAVDARLYSLQVRCSDFVDALCVGHGAIRSRLQDRDQDRADGERQHGAHDHFQQASKFADYGVDFYISYGLFIPYDIFGVNTPYEN